MINAIRQPSGAARRPRFVRFAARGVCVVAIAGLGLTSLPSVASASPATIQAPLAAQVGVGLRQGATGAEVTALQTALMSFGVFVPGGVDGVYGPATKTAVSNFQRWNGLAVTGVVDAATAAALRLGSAPTGLTAPAVGTTNTPFVGMQVGARGDNVKVLQRALIAAGFAVRGGADGVFGPMTAAALTGYQQTMGLTDNGVVDAAVVTQLALVPGAPAPAPAPTPAADPADSAFYVGLQVGSTGPLVQDLQRALILTGLALREGADGVFGNATKDALMQFQAARGATQTGVLTADDAAALALGTTTTPQGASSQTGFAVFGERGPRVTALQQALLAAGISFAGGADGAFGAGTAGAVLAFQRREGLPATGKVDQATAARLGNEAAPAPTPPSSAGVTIDVFPVQGQCWFGDTWHAPRGVGRLHQGVDIGAAAGNLLYAVVSGTVSKVYNDAPGSLAGNGLRIAQDNGTYFMYLHLDTLASGITVGTRVSAGQVVGTVGSTGNSATPHLHFEVHPVGGAAVNPFPMIKAIDACDVTAPRA